jgi:hypothetical protein
LNWNLATKNNYYDCDCQTWRIEKEWFILNCWRKNNYHYDGAYQPKKLKEKHDVMENLATWSLCKETWNSHCWWWKTQCNQSKVHINKNYVIRNKTKNWYVGCWTSYWTWGTWQIRMNDGDGDGWSKRTTKTRNVQNDDNVD